MLRSYASEYTWTLNGCEDLIAAVRRAEGVAHSFGWTSAEAAALSRIVLELGGNALRHGGGGTCRLEAGAEVADVIVEDRGPGFPERVLRALLSGLGGPGGLDSVRKLSAQLVVQNLPSGGVRARAVMVARRAVRVNLRTLAEMAA